MAVLARSQSVHINRRESCACNCTSKFMCSYPELCDVQNFIRTRYTLYKNYREMVQIAECSVVNGLGHKKCERTLPCLAIRRVAKLSAGHSTCRSWCPSRNYPKNNRVARDTWKHSLGTSTTARHSKCRTISPEAEWCFWTACGCNNTSVMLLAGCSTASFSLMRCKTLRKVLSGQ